MINGPSAKPAPKMPTPRRLPTVARAAVVGLSLVLLLAAPSLLPGGLNTKSQEFWLSLFAKFMALAILALSVDLVWGYTGLLSLGQGVFFGIGAYMIAYTLTLDRAADEAPPRPVGSVLGVDHATGQLTIGVPNPAECQKVRDKLYAFARSPDVQGETEQVELRVIGRTADGITAVVAPAEETPPEVRTGDKVARPMLSGEVPPQFMQYTGLAPNDANYVPPPGLAAIAPLADKRLAITLALVLPLLLAGGFAWVIFRFRVSGVYFALVTQALLLAVFTLVRNQQRFTGGVVGIKHLAPLQLFGLTFDLQEHVRATVWLIAGALVVSFLLCQLLIASRFGKVLTAIRDNENRVLALGYHTGRYKTFLFAFAGLLAGLSGALYVLANFPVCDTTYLSVPFSIEAVVWVAIGGRGTLLGAVVGALLVGFGQAYITSALPDQWLIVLGGLFVAVVLFMPRGLTPVAGPTALIGLLCGVLLVIYLENSRLPGMSETLLSYVDQKVGYRRAGRIFVGCPVMLLMVLVPAAVTAVVRKIGRLAWRVIGKPTPALEPSVP